MMPSSLSCNITSVKYFESIIFRGLYHYYDYICYLEFKL